MEEVLINIKNLIVSFNGNILLNGTSFTGYSSKVYGLYGKNGSGKTSFINTLTGFVKPRSGSIELYNNVVNNLSPYKISKLGGGISRTFQVPDVDEDSTIYENLSVSRRQNNESFLNLIYKKKTGYKINREFNDEIIKYLNLFDLQRNSKAVELSYGVKRLLSIIMCLLTGSRILLLDEPFANLNTGYIEILKELFINLAKQSSKLIIIIEHQPDNVLEFVDILLHIENKSIHSYDLKFSNKQEILERIIDSSFIYE